MPTRPELPNGVIAVWGKVELEPLDKDSRKLLAEGRTVKRGVLIDFLGNYNRSAREDLPLYRITGGAGFVWAGSNKNGRGILRFLAINPSEFSGTSPEQQHVPPQAGDAGYASIGGWSITYRHVGDLNGCSATKEFPDRTVFEVALI